MVETLSTFFTMHVYSWNWIFYLNCIIWCYWIRRVVLMRRSWVEAQDDWVVILNYKMWAIRSVNRVYVDNLGLTGTEETLPKFCWKFWWDLYIYIKKKKKGASHLPNAWTRAKVPCYWTDSAISPESLKIHIKCGSTIIENSILKFI